MARGLAPSAREDGYERLDDDNELGLRKAKADLGRDLWLGFLFVVASCAATSASSSASTTWRTSRNSDERHMSVCIRAFDFGARLSPTPSPRLTEAQNTGLCRLRRPHAGAPQQPRAVADAGADAALRPSLHAHALELSQTTSNWCDICGIRITTPTLWRCHPYNFDACPKCWEARDETTRCRRPTKTARKTARPGPRTWRRWRGRSRGPGSRRRAPGPGAGRGRDYQLDYCKRGGEAHASLLVARGHGAGLRRGLGRREPRAAVVPGQNHRRRHARIGRFRKMLELYLVFSVGTAATQALRALCFQVVGRRLPCCSRKRLYAAILRAEISYFDSTASGTLTSRLTQDVEYQMTFHRFQMTFLLTTLGLLVAAIISLIGGVAMAFYTSWRLSMLAFTLWDRSCT